jgi:hypothetical protein
MRAGLAALLALAGCGHVHADQGAPGLVDLAQPPLFPDVRSVEPAREPGESMVCLAPAFLATKGSRRLASGRRDEVLLGLELSLEKGTSEHNHQVDAGLDPPQRLVLPETAWGMAAGAQAVVRPGGDVGLGPLTLELRHRFGYGVFTAGGGVLWDLETRRPGLVGTAAALIFVVRAGHVSGQGAFGSIGVDLWAVTTWVRTR